MSPAHRDETLWLTDIRDAIDRILRYTAEGRDAFLADPKTQDAVVRNIEIIGEAAKNISETTRLAHPQVPWRQIAGMRDHVVHAYFRVDLALVWNVVELHLGSLRGQIAGILGEP